ncbi:protein of unknown function [Dethiosulfatibacter aminovorans DSM 17477]|uniref:DUF4387 domain-containing protein n=1 Tax=Dethiosulfatibacter aminovorans DSM 17477 TaxID=1121476 RepID=A0A1M6M1R4_9FIRM|nr:DUF4387 family protein [Dethiosulfatibacter aminovorans]SHJ77385.1 protein of unknown function [Dethiosulfatibacter aminovorans DSM 17477]
MNTIEQTVKYIRSKNAGPFWLTIDAFCNSAEDTRKVADAFEREREFIAHTYKVKPEDILVFCLNDIQVAKVSFPRVPIEGSRDERDMHGGQQYVSLLDILC